MRKVSLFLIMSVLSAPTFATETKEVKNVFKPGFYIGGGLGFSSMESDSKLSTFTYLGDTYENYHGKVSSDLGTILDINLGYEFNPYLRTEIELFYQQADYSNYTISGNENGAPFSETINTTGTLKQNGFMINGYLSIPIESWKSVKPYIGLGFGAGDMPNEGTIPTSEESSSIAQIMLGLDFKIPNEALTFSIEYRGQYAEQEATIPVNIQRKRELSTGSLIGKIRYSF